MPGEPRLVIVRCQSCRQDKEESRKPGPKPRYCLDCAPRVRRLQARMRQTRWRREHPTGVTYT
jgi:hypothetical protein